MTIVETPLTEAEFETPIPPLMLEPTILPSSTPTISPTPSPSSTPTASPAPLIASGWIAFVGKDQQLWLTTPAGQRQGPLTSEGRVESPAWSPDGDRLALGLRQPLETPISLETGDSVSLIIFTLETGESQVIFEGTSERLYFPRAWLPDGRLFFERLAWDERIQTGDYSRWTVHYTAGHVDEPQPAQNIPAAFDREAILARLPEEFRSASTHSFSWSSDGQWMVFQSGNSIYLFDWAVGGEPRQLADGASPVWQPSPSVMPTPEDP